MMKKGKNQMKNQSLITLSIKCQVILILPRKIQDIIKKYIDYDTLLLQIDSDGKYIMWGDVGIGNFFISKKSLLEKDFSNVLYNWDCCQFLKFRQN